MLLLFTLNSDPTVQYYSRNCDSSGLATFLQSVVTLGESLSFLFLDMNGSQCDLLLLWPISSEMLSYIPRW